jgi:spermidine synthase
MTTGSTGGGARSTPPEWWAGFGTSPWALCALFTSSGLTGLVYEVMWVRSFGLVFGSTTRAVSVVLASFFLGMALGNWLGGRLAGGRRNPLLLYGLLELLVAAGALLVLVWLDGFRALYPTLYQSWLGVPPILTALQVLLALIAMVPPCVAMGATLPLVSHAIVDRVGHVGRRVGLIYALNTVGATVGALLAGFVLPVALGVRASVLLAAAVNVGVGGLALLLWRAGREPQARALESAEATWHTAQAEGSPLASAPPRAGPEGLLLLVAAVSGLGTLALEVLYTRLLVNVVDSSVHGFAVMLAVFLLSLAAGSAIASAIADRLRSSWRLVAWASLLAALAVLLSIRVFEALFLAMPSGSRWTYVSWLMQVAGMVLAPPAVLVGIILPATWSLATRDVQETGLRVGRLTAVNTLAAAAGSIGAGFVLIPLFGVGISLVVVSGLYLGLGVLAAARSTVGVRRWLLCALPVAVFAGICFFQHSRLIPVHLAAGERLIFYREGDTGSVAVVERPLERAMRLNNLYVLGASKPSGVRTHRGQGELPLRLHGDPRDVAFIGVATGLSLSSIYEFPSVRRAVAMEIVPGILDAAREFSDVNRNVLEDPRVEAIVADGRNHLFGTGERFDVIVGDLFVPWHAGTGYLYTAEHFQIARARLNPGGVFAQWLQANQLSAEEFRIIAATFADVFEDAEIWRNDVQSVRTLVALVGRVPREGSPAPATKPGARVAGSHFVCGAETLRDWARSAPRNTDDHPIIEFRASARRLQGSEGASGEPEVEQVLRRLRVAERRRADGA